MIRKSVFSIVLAASLAAGGSLLISPAAFAAEGVSVAVAADVPSNPTLLWTGGQSALITWGAASDATSYEVTIAGGKVQRTKSTGSTSVTFANLPLNHRYMASVVSIDSSGARSSVALTNTVALGTPPASEAQATPSASSEPSSTPSQTSTPTVSAAPSQTPSATQSSSAPATVTTAPSTTTPPTSEPQPSQSTIAAAPSTDDSSLISQVQPGQWGIGALVALATFALLLFARSMLRGSPGIGWRRDN